MSESETLSPEYAAELLQRQDVLQAEAGRMLEVYELVIGNQVSIVERAC